MNTRCLRFIASGTLFLSLSLSAVLAATPTLPAQSDAGSSTTESAGPGTIVTVEPKKGGEALQPVPQSAVRVKVQGKDAPITEWRHYTGQGTVPDLQLVLLIDDSALSSLGLHQKELANFINQQPPTTEVGLAYMRNGTAMFVAPLSTDHAKVASAIRLTNGVPGANSSPYFALSDLVKRWPEHNADVRREIVMISDGVDRYAGVTRYDPNNPYINGTIRDLVRNQVVVYSIYYRDAGFADRTQAGIDTGQNYLTQLSQAIGGEFFFQGFSNPVNFTPYLDAINRKLANQYELRVNPPSGLKNVVNLKVQVSAPNTRTQAAEQIFVGGGK